MRPALDEGDQEFLQLLQSHREATVQELCAAAGVTATAIRQRLSRLQDLNFVVRITIRAGRGRPHHRYELTDAGRQALGDNYGELAILLWEELRRIEDRGVRDGVLARLRDQFARRLGVGVTGNSLEQRLSQLQSALTARGFDVQAATLANGDAVLREHHCPYHELAIADTGICELEQQVFEQILGSPLQLLQSCRDGASCCEFRLVGSRPTAAVAGRG